MFGIFAALAEFERELIRERTVAGLKAARARGRKGGRKFALPKAHPFGVGYRPLRKTRISSTPWAATPPRPCCRSPHTRVMDADAPMDAKACAHSCLQNRVRVVSHSAHRHHGTSEVKKHMNNRDYTTLDCVV